MPTKRSRLMRSASIGDAEVVAPQPRRPSVSPDLLWQQRMSPVRQVTSVDPFKSSDQPRQVIFSISSPVHERPAVGGEVETTHKFFEKCYYCKKTIPLDEDVYMYSELRAFCSEECRAKEIEMEEAVKKARRRAASKRARELFGTRHRRQNTT